MANSFKKKLTITDQSQIATFTRNGEDAMIYKVEAITEAGEVVNPEEYPLRTFDADLPQGELIEFEVSPYDSEKYGRSYTLKMPSKGRASKKDVSTMQAQLTKLADRVAQVEKEIGELKAGATRTQPLGQRPEDDIPF